MAKVPKFVLVRHLPIDRNNPGERHEIHYRSGNFNLLLQVLHRISPFSWDYSFRYAGWGIIDTETGKKVQ